MDTAKAPAADTATPVAKPVLVLESRKDITQSCSATFEPKAPPCSQTFESVIYATDEEEFWLLTKTTAGAMTEAIQTLEKQISPTKSNVDRLVGLNSCGLLDYLLEPKLSNFLQGAEKARMEEIETQEPDIAYGAPAALRSRQAKAQAEQSSAAPTATAPATSTSTGRELSIERMKAYEQQQAALKKLHDDIADMGRLYSEWNALKKKATGIAKSKGYTYENGSLFNKQAMEARAAVKDYLEKRKALLDDDGVIKNYDATQLAQTLADTKALEAQVRGYMALGEGNLYVYDAYLTAYNNRAAYLDYTKAVIKVADYGLAVPEYALMNGDDVETGIKHFNEYLTAQKNQLDVNQRLRKKYQGWIDATGQNAKAPAGLVDLERAEWERLQTVKEALKEQAQRNVSTTDNKRHLLWDPEQFQPQPVDRLVNAGFPLREVSVLGAKKKPLSWLSVLNLANIGETLKADLKKSGKKTAKELLELPANGDGGAGKDSAQTAFGQWLTQNGALRIDDQAGDWFTTEGWFDIEAFHKFLLAKGITIKQLENGNDRKEWGDRLKQVVLKKSMRSRLRIFDKSPQAQLVRCLTPPQENIHHEFKGEAPKLSVSKGFEMSGSASLSYDLARGEVELLKIDMPDRIKATDLMVKYYVDDDTTPHDMNIGRFSMHFGARAWGYAGVSLMLAGSIELGRGNTKYGATLDPIKPVQREDAAAEEERKPYDDEVKRKKEAKDESPTAPVVHESKAATVISNNSYDSELAAKKAPNVQVEKGIKANFNLFAGVQAGIELTGAMNWAPPKDLVALRSAPTGGSYIAGEATADNPWLTLAKLNGSLGVAVGAGIKADAELSLDRGKFILALKASLIFGPGATGSLKMEVGYEAVVDIINMFRRVMHEHDGHHVRWMTEEAEDLVSRLTVLGAVGLDVPMVYMMGIDVIMSLYEALTSGGRGGPIAHTIMNYHNTAELHDWFINAMPKALGPILSTLTAEPTSFKIVDSNFGQSSSKSGTIEYKAAEAYLLQQKAIARILGWISSTADPLTNIQTQFEESCKRMNKFGTKPKAEGQAYCEGRYALDVFMSVEVLSLEDSTGITARKRYKENTKLMGQRMEGRCKIAPVYSAFVHTPVITYQP